jgi:hypothetical protein
MTGFNTPPKFSRQIAMLTAGIFLLVAPQGALAKHKDHSDDHGAMESAAKGMDSEKHKGKHKDKEYAEKDMNSEKHKDKGKDKYAEKTKDKDKHETPGTTADNNTSGTGKPGEVPTNSGIIPTGPVPGTPAPVAVSGPGAVNTIHPIASPPPHTVTISDGVNTFQIPDGAGGVTVTSTRPGTITVSNGVQTQTLSGIKMTISGALGVGVAKGIQVGRPDAPGSTVIMAQVTGSSVLEEIPGALKDTYGKQIEDLGKDIGGLF